MEAYLLITSIIISVIILIVLFLKKNEKSDVETSVKELEIFIKEEVLELRRENRELNK